jgi:hypothetical protein
MEKGTRPTARIIADVNPATKDQLVSMSRELNKSMTEILSILIDEECTRLKNGLSIFK